jgi:four helix bundle protein
MPKSIHDLVAFQRAVDLAVEVYDVSAAFPKHELYGLTAQIRRAAISIPSNIAEGQGRLSFGEWRQFLSHARGSLFEIEAQLTVALRLGFTTEPDAARIRKFARAAAKPLAGLIRWVKDKERSTKQPNNSTTQQPTTATPQSTSPYPPAPARKTRQPAT